MECFNKSFCARSIMTSHAHALSHRYLQRFAKKDVSSESTVPYSIFCASVHVVMHTQLTHHQAGLLSVRTLPMMCSEYKSWVSKSSLQLITLHVYACSAFECCVATFECLRCKSSTFSIILNLDLYFIHVCCFMCNRAY